MSDRNELNDLVEIWKTLEAFVVSLDRIGSYWLFKGGEEAAKTALVDFLSSEMSDRLAEARRLALDIIIEKKPEMEKKLEELAEDEDAIGYWQGTKNK